MTVENGGEQPANDTALPVEKTADTTQAAENTEAEDTEGQETEEGADDDEEELDLDGEKFRIPRKVREAIAKPFQQDYSRKTEEVAQGRKALDTEREAFGKTREAQQAHFQDAAKVVAMNDRLAEIEGEQGIGRYKNVDWLTLSQTNNEQYQHHRAIYDSLKDQREDLTRQRDTAARTWTDKEKEYASNANREHGERIAKATAEIAKQVEGWSPGNELDVKLVKYGNSKGLSGEDMSELAIRAPVLVKLLNEHRVFSEAAAKQKTQQTFQASQEAKPVTRVGGSGGSAARKTTDSSGDTLSMAEWSRREDDREAAKRKASGRR